MATTKFKQITSDTDMYTAADLYTKSEVDGKIGTAVRYKGSVQKMSDLPPTGNVIGDMYNVLDTGKNYIWAENPDMKDPPVPGWDEISGLFDVDAYTKDESDGKFATITNLESLTTTVTNHTGDSTIHVTTTDKTTWNGHVNNADIHVTTNDKATWNGKQGKITVNGVVKGDGNGTMSVATAADLGDGNGSTVSARLTAADNAASAAQQTANSASATANAACPKANITTYLTTGDSGVLKAFPTSGYKLEDLITHYNNLLSAFKNLVDSITPSP